MEKMTKLSRLMNDNIKEKYAGERFEEVEEYIKHHKISDIIQSLTTILLVERPGKSTLNRKSKKVYCQATAANAFNASMFQLNRQEIKIILSSVKKIYLLYLNVLIMWAEDTFLESNIFKQ
jgi:hypothetical protein